MKVTYTNHVIHERTITVDDYKVDAFNHFMDTFNRAIMLMSESEGKKLSFNMIVQLRNRLDMMFEAGIKGFENE